MTEPDDLRRALDAIEEFWATGATDYFGRPGGSELIARQRGRCGMREPVFVLQAGDRRERSIRANVCGAAHSSGSSVICTRAPHGVGWHLDSRGGESRESRAQWSQAVGVDGSRMWPDGHFGPRSVSP